MSDKIDEAIAMTVPPGYCSPGGRTSCLHLSERERCTDCPTIDNPGAGAEPATSVRPSRDSHQVGRTGGSIPPTGANFDDLIYNFEEAVANREKGISRSWTAMTEEIDRCRDELLAAIHQLADANRKEANPAAFPSHAPGCHCGKDGHALNSVNCPVHGYVHVPKDPI